MSVQKVRYGSYNVLVESQADEFIAHIERALTRERVGGPVKASSFDEVVVIAKLETLRISD